MTLVDSSVWIDHFRRPNVRLAALLESGECEMHDAVLGELACGKLPQRAETLSLLGSLPRVRPASAGEAMLLIERARLQGLGLGWTDVILLASALTARTTLWTLDERMASCAKRLGVTGQGA